ncbi:MAG: hypothetical protein CMM23_20385 [Rhodospirillaceae bacterium]|nr:hypothetical protein [Rhodospirillaceae bacterium]
MLYIVAGRALNYAEMRRGERFEHRSFIFFTILLAFAVLSFGFIQKVAVSDFEVRRKNYIHIKIAKTGKFNLSIIKRLYLLYQYCRDFLLLEVPGPLY